MKVTTDVNACDNKCVLVTQVCNSNTNTKQHPIAASPVEVRGSRFNQEAVVYQVEMEREQQALHK